MSTCFHAIESCSDVVSSEPPSNGDIAVSNEVKVGDDDMLESKTGALTMEASCDHDGGGTVVENSIDDDRVSSEAPSNSDIAVSNRVKVGDDDVLESKTEALNHDGGSTVVEMSIDDARVNSEPPSNSDIAVINGVKVGADDMLESKTGALTMEESCDHDGGGTVVENSIDDARVSSEPPSNSVIAVSNRVKVGDDDMLESKTEALNHDGGSTVVEMSSDDARVNSEPPSKSDIAVGNGVKVGDDDMLELKTGALTMEASCDHDGGGTVVENSIDDDRVSSEAPSNSDIAVSDGVKVGDDDMLESKTEALNHDGSSTVEMSIDDARVFSEPPSNSDVAVGNGVKVGDDDMLESKTGALTKEASCDHDGGGAVVVNLIDDARVSSEAPSNSDIVVKTETPTMEASCDHDGGGTVVENSIDDARVSSEPPSNSDIAVSAGVKVGDDDILESKTRVLTMEASCDHGGGGTVVENLIDDARVSSEPPSNSDIAVSNGAKVGDDDMLESKTGALTMQASCDHDGGGTVVENSIDDARVSSEPPSNSDIDVSNGVKVGDDDMLAGALTMEASCDHDGGGTVVENSIDDARVSSEPPSNSDIAVSNEVMVGDDGVLELKTRGLTMEASCDHDGGSTVVEMSIDDARVSSEAPSNSDIAVSNGVKVGDDMLESKTGALTMEPSCDHDGGGTVVENSIDDARDSRVVTENIEKVSDKNGAIEEEKEGVYKVTDLVWGKVKSYPWWPGQIFDPSASTDKARKYSNKKGFLVAYFGDQTFAWNKPLKIKPFRKNFCKMEKQSNSKGFIHAVNCALDEVSRRVEFGLACSCLSEEAYSKIKSQVFVNAGIRKEASTIDGGDNFSTVATFKPANVVTSVQDLAREHFDGISRLEVLSLRAQLLAYYHWKGYNQFSSHDLVDGSDDKIEDISELPSMGKDKMVEDAKPAPIDEKVSSKKRKSTASDSVSQKHQHVHNGDKSSSKKESVLQKRQHVHNGDKSSSKKESVSQKRQHVHNGDKSSSKKERRLEQVIPKSSSSLSKGDNKNRNKKDGGKRTTVERNGFKEESRKGVADRKPSVSSPKRQFRVGDSICRIAKQLSESPSILKKEPKRSKVAHPPTDEMRETNDEKSVDEGNTHGSEVTEADGHKDTEGSCSTDRTVPSNPDEQVLSKENSTTALILKFTNLESVPSVSKLNEIFSRYGAVREAETEVMKKSNCAKVVFEAKSNAETAFSSAGKFSIFGPSLVSYRLNYSPSPRKSATGKKQNKKDGKSVEAIQVEE